MPGFEKESLAISGNGMYFWLFADYSCVFFSLRSLLGGISTFHKINTMTLPLQTNNNFLLTSIIGEAEKAASFFEKNFIPQKLETLLFANQKKNPLKMHPFFVEDDVSEINKKTSDFNGFLRS